MAKIERYNGNLAAFASQADTNRRTTFGTEVTGDDTLDGNITPDYLTGWQIVGPNEFPTLEDFNAAFFTIGRLMAYVHQVGMPEWNGEQEYHIGSMVNRAGVMYICTTDNHTDTTPPESDATNWRLLAAADIGYDNAASGVNANTVQDALDIFGQQSLSPSGYQALPGGLIVQWGKALDPGPNLGPGASQGGIDVPYPITFPNSAFMVVASASGARVGVGAYLDTSSGFSFDIRNFDSSTSTGVNYAVYYIAIGH